jgi:uncharacterized alpha-E superfamily protein
MLSRTADHLYWMSRYTERAENTARMLNVSYETSLLPQSAAVAQVGWEGLLSISELLPSYTALYGRSRPRASWSSWSATRTTPRPSSPACAPRARTRVPCAAP